MLVTESVNVEMEDYARWQEDPGLSGDRKDQVAVKYVVEAVAIGGKPHVKYSNLEAVRYARRWCREKMNSCGVYFEGYKRSDCAHFLSHCLHKGGITIKREEGPDECRDKLSVKVTEIVRVLTHLSHLYKNIYPISYDEGIYGDPAYLETAYVRPSHAVLVYQTKPVAEEPDKRETLYFAHSAERCGEKGDLAWYQNFGGAFRIYDAR